MGLMKKVDIEIKNSLALSFLHHEIKALQVQVKGLGMIAKELLTAVDLKHLDETKETNPCIHEWHADQDNDCNTCIKCGARQEIYTE